MIPEQFLVTGLVSPFGDKCNNSHIGCRFLDYDGCYCSLFGEALKAKKEGSPYAWIYHRCDDCFAAQKDFKERAQ
jgi:hypothetical protein